MEDEALYEIYVTNGHCQVVTLVVGSQELNHMLERIDKSMGFEAIAVHCIEPELQHFLSNCYSMNAVIEG